MPFPMWLQTFFDAIDASVVGRFVRRQRAIVEQTDPERIYVENVRAFFGLPHSAARFLCEEAVREGFFEKRIGLICPSCGRILTSEAPGESGEGAVSCASCLSDERDQWEFPRSEVSTIEFYRLPRANA
jgi:hypothetical protein